LLRIQRGLALISFFRVIVLVLAVSILALLWLPLTVREFLALPVLVMASIGFLLCGWRFARTSLEPAASAKSSINLPGATAVVVGLAVLSAGWSVSAQPAAPRSYPVFVIDSPKPSVLVGPELIARLEELEKQSALGSPDGVLVSARYAGK